MPKTSTYSGSRISWLISRIPTPTQGTHFSSPVGRVKERVLDIALSLPSEPYVQLSLYTAQAISKPLDAIVNDKPYGAPSNWKPDSSLRWREGLCGEYEPPLH
jgi:hypothetical protein